MAAEGAVNEYFTPLLAKLKTVDIVVKEGRGKCLVTKKAAKEGEVLFFEEPIASIQFPTNEEKVIACCHCHRFVGTLQQQMNHLATVRVPNMMKESLGQEQIEALEAENAAEFPDIDLEAELPLMAEEASKLTPVVKCPFSEWACREDRVFT